MAKFCSSCGKENTDDAKFCILCGNPFDPVVAKNDQQAEAEQPAEKTEQDHSGINTAYYPKSDQPTAAEGSAQTKVIFNWENKKYKWFDFQNPIALIMYIIAGLVLIVGFILGIVYGVNRYDIYDYGDYYSGFSFATMFWYWIKSFIVAAFFVATGEIINILQKILNKRDRPEE